jgi:hypothetical protein
MDNDWYLLELAVQTPEGQRHTRKEWYEGETAGRMAMHIEIAMGQWNKWCMTGPWPHPKQLQTRYVVASGTWTVADPLPTAKEP